MSGEIYLTLEVYEGFGNRELEMVVIHNPIRLSLEPGKVNE